MRFMLALWLLWLTVRTLDLTTAVITVSALSITAALDQIKFNKLSAAFSSPSGKLTLSPELSIPEPKDATSILLLTNAVQTLSERIRSCKSNVAFVRGSITALQTFANEQTTANGNFPGPVPTVYCYGNGNTNKSQHQDLADIVSAGADGVLLELNLCDSSPDESQSINDVISNISEDWIRSWKAVVNAGLQPIPELNIGEKLYYSVLDNGLDSLIEPFIRKVAMEPVAIVITLSTKLTVNNLDEQELSLVIPKVSNSLSKKVPIIGSIRAASDGENRLLYEETIKYKEAGFTGTFLRWDCVPGYQLQPNLDFVGQFWFACISDLKSTRSKVFSFRSKNNLDVSAATKWGNYQRSVIESGALGDPNDSTSINEENGDYQGFA